VPDGPVARRRVLRVDGDAAAVVGDQLVAEEPMELRVGGQAVAVAMRTPGADLELALGFCLTEGVVARAEDVAGIRTCRDDPNVVEVDLRPGIAMAADLRRNLYTTSSCGLCGTASIAAVRKQAAPVHGDTVRVTAAALAALPDRLRAHQRVFARTGGLHAAALFGPDGDLRVVREDVGRHNAVDKVVGWAAVHRHLPLAGHVLFVSGRIAFEIAQKALIAAVPVVAAVSAPSALAVDLADDAGMTLVGFLRGARMNVYTHPDRVVVGPGPA
jgi:FdhD protein